MSTSQADLHKYFKVTKKIQNVKNNKLHSKAPISTQNKAKIVGNAPVQLEFGLHVSKDLEKDLKPQKEIKNNLISNQDDTKHKEPKVGVSSFQSVFQSKESKEDSRKQIESDEKDKLSPAEIKRRLGKCGRLDELRERLIKLNKCESNLKEFRSKGYKREEVILPPSPHKPYTPPKKRLKLDTGESPKIQNFRSFDIEVPVSPSKTPVKSVTPSKISSPSVQGVQSIPEDLNLPHRYQVLKEIFRAVDTVVSLLHNRQEIITFSKLKPAVQEMLKKTFSQTHLGQIKTVFPLAYFFSQEKVCKKSGGGLYELIVKPNFLYKKPQVHVRNLSMDFGSSTESNKFRKLDSVVLVERRNVFHMALLEILQKHHEEFLQSLDPPINLKGPVLRWHPDFMIEDVDVPAPSPLPKSPEVEAPGTAMEMMDKARGIFSMNNRMKEAVETAVKTTSSKIEEPEVKYVPEEPKNDIAIALKGVSLSLLEKIRAREAAKMAREMTRSSEASKELVMLSRLPELARVLRSLFVTEKKNALPIEFILSRVAASHSNGLSSSEVESHLDLLISFVPDWCTRHKVRGGLYLKINKSRELQTITDRLNAVIKEKT